MVHNHSTTYYRKHKIMLLRHLSLLAFVISIYAASEETSTDITSIKRLITFQNCLTLKEATIPGKSDLNWFPFSIWKKVASTKTLDTKHAKHNHGLHACIGFIGSTEKQLAQDVAYSLSTDEAMLWQDCWDGIYTIDQVTKTVATVHLMFGRYSLHPLQTPPIVIAHTDNLNQQIMAPAELHTAFEQQTLNPADELQVDQMNRYAQQAAEGSHSVPYFAINHEMLNAFCTQEQIDGITEKRSGS